MQNELALLREDNERQQIIISALVAQNKLLIQKLANKGLAANSISADEQQIGRNEPDISNLEQIIGCNNLPASNLHQDNGCNELLASNLYQDNGCNSLPVSNLQQVIGRNGFVASRIAVLPTTATINLDVLKDLLLKNGVASTRVSLASSAAILCYCLKHATHAYHSLMALTGFSEGGVTKRMIALKQKQMLYRSGKQYYTLTPKALAMLQAAIVN